MKKIVLSMLILISLTQITFALDLLREERLNFEHLIVVSNISSLPTFLTPGDNAELKFTLTNTGDQFVKDVRVKIEYPSGIAPFNDVNERKLFTLIPKESKEVVFSLVAYPSSSEGVYKIPIQIDYLNSIGDERNENLTASLIVRGSPKPYVILKDTEIYQDNALGTVTFSIINSKPANVRFLSVEIGTSSNYEIIGPTKEYVGDLDADDFQDVNFNLRVKTNSDGKTLPSQFEVPVSIEYSDAFNTLSSEKFALTIPVRTAKEIGKEKNMTGYYILAIVILVWIAYILIRRYRRRKQRMGKN